MFDFTGKSAIVTGASYGLGEVFAHDLAKAGCALTLTARSSDLLEAVAEQCRQLGSPKVIVVIGDVSVEEDVVRVVDETVAKLGGVDILINNAGIPDAQRAHKMPLDLIDRVFDTNLRGPYVLSCEVARRLIEADMPGRMVNISSIGAFRYEGNGAALYSITKAGIARMSEALAVEWARYHINVNAIAPGAFSSEMMDGMMERMGDITRGMPRKRIGDPAQLDSTLLYLCGPASDAVTGTVIKVDDGQSSR